MLWKQPFLTLSLQISREYDNPCFLKKSHWNFWIFVDKEEMLMSIISGGVSNDNRQTISSWIQSLYILA